MDISESFLAHLAFILPSLFVRRPSVNISHFNLLLRNHWANCSQTLKGTHPRTIPARFSLIWFSGFRGEDLNVIFYQNMPKN
jgi:hypothetical protein